MIGMLSPLEGIFFWSNGALCAARAPERNSSVAPPPIPALRKLRRPSFIAMPPRRVLSLVPEFTEKAELKIGEERCGVLG
jgi:hypothetical protein